MKEFLTEPMEFTFHLDEAEEQDGIVKMRGLFQRSEVKNGNGRVYPKNLLERELNKLMPAIKERRVMGEIDHPADPKIHLDKVSHLITGLTVEGNDIYGELEVLQTPAGKLLEALIKSGVKLGISSRGTGSLREDRNRGINVVQEDFNLITWDIVGDPSTPGAWVSLSESLIGEDNFSDAAKIIKRERAFDTALRTAARELFKIEGE